MEENRLLNASWVPEPHHYEVQDEKIESQMETNRSAISFENTKDIANKDFHSLAITGTRIDVTDDLGTDLNLSPLGEEKSSGEFSEGFSEIQGDFDLGDDQRTESVGTEIFPLVFDVTEEDRGSLDFYEIQDAWEMEEQREVGEVEFFLQLNFVVVGIIDQILYYLHQSKIELFELTRLLQTFP